MSYHREKYDWENPFKTLRDAREPYTCVSCNAERSSYGYRELCPPCEIRERDQQARIDLMDRYSAQVVLWGKP